jgi:monoamine oxidase
MTSDEAEVVVIGGGAAGIAAARRLHDGGVDCLLLEARPRLGGRAWTIDDRRSASPLDLGCGWLHSADRNPWLKIAETQGAFHQRASLAEGEPDRAAVTLLDPDCRWSGLINAVSTYVSGAELDRVSVRDFARYDDSGINWRIVQGYGAAIAAHGADLRVMFGCKVRRIDHSGRRLRVETSNGATTADAIIVTLPSTVLAEDELLFRPALPEKVEAAAGVPLGLADKLFPFARRCRGV